MEAMSGASADQVSAPSPKRLGLPKRTPTPAKDASEAEHVRARVDAQLRELLAHHDGSLDSSDPEDLHQYRVAIRRLRSLLRNSSLFGIDGKRTRDDLRWIGSATSPIRDLDVLLLRLRDEVAGLTGPDEQAAEVLMSAFEAERDHLRTTLAEAFADDRYSAMLHAIAQLATGGDEHGERTGTVELNGVKLIASLNKPFRKLAKAADGLGEDPPDDDLHELRIHAKRLRYAAETALPSAGDEDRSALKSLVKSCKGLQEVLGDHQDGVVAAERIRGLLYERDDFPPGVALVGGRLIEREAQRRAELRERWPGNMREVTGIAAPLLDRHGR